MIARHDAAYFGGAAMIFSPRTRRDRPRIGENSLKAAVSDWHGPCIGTGVQSV
jgi:hypothetical protein